MKATSKKQFKVGDLVMNEFGTVMVIDLVFKKQAGAYWARYAGEDARYMYFGSELRAVRKDHMAGELAK